MVLRLAIGTRALILLVAGWLLAACATQGGEPTSDARAVGELRIEGAPMLDDAVAARLSPYGNVRAARLYGFVQDTALISTRFAQTDQLHRVAQPMGARTQLSFYPEPVGAVAVPPHGTVDGVILSRDAGGSEYFQLFYFDLKSGESRMLSNGRSRYGQVVWRADGQAFAYTTTERNERDWDIHVQFMDGRTEAVLESDSGAWGALDFSPDGKRLLVSRYFSINHVEFYELDLATGDLTPLLDPELKVAVNEAYYSKDGQHVYFTSDVGAEFMRLHRLDLASQDIEVLTGDIPWNVEYFALSPDGQHLGFAVNQDGLSRIEIWRTDSPAPLALPEMPSGIVTSLTFSPDGERLGFTLNSPTQPSDVYALKLDGRVLERWTSSEMAGLAELVNPDLVRYPTFDQVDGAPREIPAFVFRPNTPGPHPVVINIHGGPEGQYRPYFSSTVQGLVNELGVAVIAPNVRGSNGYGKSYLKLDNGMLREDSVKDIGALLDWIKTQPDLDAERVAVIGGSYGGYMVLASMVTYGERIRAGAERVGISNFVTFLENTKSYRRDLRRREYGDERDPAMRAFLERISPLNQVDKIQRPLMVSQGFNDPRVPASESAQIKQALEGSNVPVWYLVAMDEGHGFRKKFNRDYQTALTYIFFEKYLLGDE